MLATDRINLADPVNRDHPLSKGRVRWYLSLPEYSGGDKMRDLMAMRDAPLLPPDPGVGFGYPLFFPAIRRGALGPAIETPSNVDSWIECPWISQLSAVSVFTVIWSMRKVASSGKIGWRVLLDSSNLIGYETYTDGNAYGFLSAGALAYFSHTFDVADLTWHRIAMVFDGSGAGNSDRAKLYIDGVLQSLTFSGASIPTATATMVAPPLEIGRLPNVSQDPGRYDDFAIFDRALSASEVVREYQSAVEGHPDQLNRIDLHSWVALLPGTGPTVITGSDSISVAESRAVAAVLAETDTITWGEASGLSTSSSGTDAFSLGESAIVNMGTVVITGADTISVAQASTLAASLAETTTITFGESSAVSIDTTLVSGADTISVAESSTLAAVLAETDAITLGEARSLAVVLAETDAITLGESGAVGIDTIIVVGADAISVAEESAIYEFAYTIPTLIYSTLVRVAPEGEELGEPDPAWALIQQI